MISIWRRDVSGLLAGWLAVPVLFLGGCISPVVALPPPVQSSSVSTSPLLSESANVSSDVGVEFGWGLLIDAPSLAGERFSRFEYRSGLLETHAGRYVGLRVAFDESDPTRRTATGLDHLEVGSTPEAVEALAYDPQLASKPTAQPVIPGFRYIDGTRLFFRRQEAPFIGIWRSEDGQRTLVATFDSDRAARPTHRVVATTAFPAAVISVNGSHHLAQPTWILLATDPASNGEFRLVNLLWPQAEHP